MSTSTSNSTPMLPISGEPPPSSLGTLAVLRVYRSALHQRRPWAEFLDVNSVSKPTSLSDAAARVRSNFSYFRSNYLTLLAAALALSLITHPLSLLILLSILAAWIAFYSLRRPPDQPFIILWGRKFSDREALGVLLTATAIAMFLTTLGSLIVSGLGIGAVIVTAHGAFRSPDVMFLHQRSSSTSSTPSASSFSLVGSIVSPPVVPPVF